MTAATIGEQLRLAREERQIPLREVSDETRISIHYLEAIEANDFNRLPGGIFNRSFVKAYARCVGFDEKEAVEGYTRYMRGNGRCGRRSRQHSFSFQRLYRHSRNAFADSDRGAGNCNSGDFNRSRLAVLKWYQRRSTELLRETSSSQE